MLVIRCNAWLAHPVMTWFSCISNDFNLSAICQLSTSLFAALASQTKFHWLRIKSIDEEEIENKSEMKVLKQ